MPTWPKDKLLKHGPELPIKERVRRYQHNIRAIRESGCAIPPSACVDTLDPAEIELWFADNSNRISAWARPSQVSQHCLGTAGRALNKRINRVSDKHILHVMAGPLM
ncbi:hypothetical protein GCM10010869_30330 [Mesorhizobium tianshanense]|uniref:Uncharacterized protein n=1 Tax=Mesorhizobium tianshanense TaxID=39844 RepID=A0A562MV46_9HYPH|nr:hypothetical protein [Mesorhizobium tianshanense]TWI23750.1 hypothetical protein IQ26_06412 [Mesorhizobium tianshanense]GLS37440.1 hypothetical protein GCM10010869_30330 [Mesorhizobium tianshanense]